MPSLSIRYCDQPFILIAETSEADQPSDSTSTTTLTSLFCSLYLRPPPGWALWALTFLVELELYPFPSRVYLLKE